MASSNQVIWWLLGGALLIFIGIIPLSASPAGPVVALAGFIGMLIGSWFFTQVKKNGNGHK